MYRRGARARIDSALGKARGGGNRRPEEGGADHGDASGEAGAGRYKLGDEENRHAWRNWKRNDEAGGGSGNCHGTTQF